MTTSVKIMAHCFDDKQVRITRKNLKTETNDQTVLQNGETSDQVVYDDWSVSVEEELKAPE